MQIFYYLHWQNIWKGCEIFVIFRKSIRELYVKFGMFLKSSRESLH